MSKWKRSERVGALIEKLTASPGKLFSLGDFATCFDAARSTISEDLAVARQVLKRLGRGHVETIAGPAGGVRYLPGVAEWRRIEFLTALSQRLANPERILPGDYIYMTDCIYDPRTCNILGEIFASYFYAQAPDAVVTVETKGIPLAMATAYFLNVPVIAARRDHLITEGTSVSINYVSGSSRSIQTMSLARRSLESGMRVLVIDDFMRGGGTIKGLMELMHEFEVSVVGVGVLLATSVPEKKIVDNYISMLILDEVDTIHNEIKLHVAPIYKK